MGADVRHTVCSAHDLRVARAGGDRHGGLGGPVQELLRLVGLATRIEGEEGIAQQLRLVKRYVQGYDHLLRVGLECREALGLRQPRAAGGKRQPRHNLAFRLRNFNMETLRFLRDPRMRFTNNSAERNPRMLNLHGKLSAEFRSAQDLATTYKALSTARMQGRDRIEVLRQRLSVLLTCLHC